MPILLTCDCGKKLRAKEDWKGTKVKCPGCGKVLKIPDEQDELVLPVRADPPVKSAPSKKPVSDNDSDEDNGGSDEPRKRKKKRKKKARLALPAIDFFGMTPAKWGIVLTIVAVVAITIYLFIPANRPKIVDARRVDIFAALEVADRNAAMATHAEGRGVREAAAHFMKKRMEEETGISIPPEVHEISSAGPGDSMLLVTRDNPAGSHVIVKMEIPPKFLLRNAPTQAGTIQLKADQFRLKGDDGQDQAGLILDLEVKAPDHSKGTLMDISTEPANTKFFPRKRMPWYHEGNIVDETEKKVERVHVGVHEQTIQSYTGTARFEGQGGMKVDYEFHGNGVHVTWDAGSTVYVGGKYAEFDNEFWFHSLELTFAFPRPAGKDISLVALGETVKHFKVP
jgi:hypothetical protein